MSIDDLIDKFNWIDKLHGLVWTVTSYLPHRRSHKGRKVGPWRVDGGTRRIEVDRRAHSGAEVERIGHGLRKTLSVTADNDAEAVEKANAKMQAALDAAGGE